MADGPRRNENQQSGEKRGLWSNMAKLVKKTAILSICLCLLFGCAGQPEGDASAGASSGPAPPASQSVAPSVAAPSSQAEAASSGPFSPYSYEGTKDLPEGPSTPAVLADVQVGDNV